MDAVRERSGERRRRTCCTSCGALRRRHGRHNKTTAGSQKKCNASHRHTRLAAPSLMMPPLLAFAFCFILRSRAWPPAPSYPLGVSVPRWPLFPTSRRRSATAQQRPPLMCAGMGLGSNDHPRSASIPSIDQTIHRVSNQRRSRGRSQVKGSGSAAFRTALGNVAKPEKSDDPSKNFDERGLGACTPSIDSHAHGPHARPIGQWGCAWQSLGGERAAAVVGVFQFF